MSKWKSYEILALAGGIIQLASGYAGTCIGGVFKEFLFDGNSYKYYNWELVNLEGGLFGNLCWAIALWLFVDKKIVKKSMQWFIDFIVIDMYFVYAKNPYVLDNYKITCFVLATVTFVGFYFIGDYFLPFIKRK